MRRFAVLAGIAIATVAPALALAQTAPGNSAVGTNNGNQVAGHSSGVGGGDGGGAQKGTVAAPEPGLLLVAAGGLVGARWLRRRSRR